MVEQPAADTKPLQPLKEGITNDLEQLCQVIGPRPSFSPSNLAAAEYISDRMGQLGLKVEIQSFECPAWDCTRAELRTGGKMIKILPNPYSPSCKAHARLVLAGTLEELEALPGGEHILVLYGDLTRTPIACKSWFLREPRDERIVARLEELSPPAILTVQAQPGSVNRIIEDAEFSIPSATLPAESAERLISLNGCQADLILETNTHAGSTANIVGRRVGSSGRDRVVLCAHYDTKIDTPGALDNASGVACMLAAARQLLSQPMTTDLEVVAFTNEEYLPIGDDTYLALVGEGSLETVRLAINFDGVGHRLGVNTLAIFSASDELVTLVKTLKAGVAGVQWVEPWPESNHSTFAWRGVPALAFSSSGAWTHAHQLGDDLQRVSSGRVEEAARLAAHVVQSIQDVPLSWLRPHN
jgi:aminopeptidase YwaD